MEIHHCLFLIMSHKITAVLYQSRHFVIMPFDGDETNILTDDYWERWKAYRGFCSDDLADVCFISDEPMASPLPLASSMCNKAESIWYTDKIKDALSELNICNPMKIFSDTGRLLLRFDDRIRKQPEEEIIMNAYCVRFSSDSDSNTSEGEDSYNNITPFIAYHLNKLKQYDEENRKR